MSISVSCPGCSASFKVKDEKAGKRAECPECGERVTVPAEEEFELEVVEDEPAPVRAKPVMARPVTAKPVAAKPRSVEEDEDEPQPKSKRRRDEDDDEAERPRKKKLRYDDDEAEAPKTKAKRRRDDDEEEDAPKSTPKRKQDEDDEDDTPKGKKRQAAVVDEDEEDDRPRKSRRRGEDDEPKKKSKLPLVLGILGGLVLLCGGGGAGVYYGVIAPMAEQARQRNKELGDELDRLSKDTGKSPTDNSPVRADNVVGRINPGDTLAHVEGILGKGRPAELATVSLAAAGAGLNEEGVRAWQGHAELGHVVIWEGKLGDRVLTAFEAPPQPSSKVVSYITRFDGKTSSGGSLSGPTPTTPKLEPGEQTTAPVATLTPDELLRDGGKYANKYVLVRGKLKDDLTLTTEWADFALEQTGEQTIKWDLGPTYVSAVEAKKGATVEVWAYVLNPKSTDGKFILANCMLHSPGVTVTAAALLDEHRKSPDGSGKYDGRPIRVTGTVKGFDNFRRATLEERVIDGVTYEVRVLFEHADHKLVKVGDSIIVMTTGRELADGDDGKKEILMVGARYCPAGPKDPTPPTPPSDTPAVSAADLAAEFDTDAKAAEARYKDKPLTVKGMVAAVSKDGSELTLTGVAGGPGKKTIAVFVTMAFDDWMKSQSLKPGDAVTLDCSGKLLRFRQDPKDQTWTVNLSSGRLVKTTGGTTPTKPDPTPTTPDPTPPVGDPDSLQPVVTLTSADLASAIKKYDGKWVVVAAGAARDAVEGTDLQAVPLDIPGVELRVSYVNGGTLPVAVKQGQRMEVWGQLAAGPGNAILLQDSVLLNPVVEAKLGEVYDAFVKDGKAAAAKYGSQPYKFSATVTAVEGGVVTAEERPGGPRVSPSFPPSEMKRIKKGDTITFVGVADRVLKTGAGQTLTVNNCLLVPKQLPPGPK